VLLDVLPHVQLYAQNGIHATKASVNVEILFIAES
jgi:hypothetical protein